jgi:signal transduction histidine kinase
MKRLALRSALSALGLMSVLFGCALLLVLTVGGTAIASNLGLVGLGTLALSVCLSVLVFVQARRVEQEISRLHGILSGDDGDNAALQTFRFEETHALAAALSALRERSRQPAAARPAPSMEAGHALRLRFVAAMGHDLRSPLNAMVGFADLLAVDPQATWREQQKRSLEVVRERARDLLTLIDNIVDWAKLQAGELALTPAPVAADQVLARTFQLAKARSGARGLLVRFEAGPGLGTLLVDEGRFTQALLGLMEHATRSEAGPTLSVRAGRLAASAGTAEHVRIELDDPLLEVREADRAHLFEAFRPSFAPSGQRIAGLSLGTAIARALLRAQGGDVWFESLPGQGTKFVVTVKVASLA